MHASTKHLVTLMFLVLSSVSCSVFGDEIQPSRKWVGTSSAAGLVSSSPSDGVIQDTASWKKLWSNWQPEKEVPQVDFASSIIVVATVRGFNEVRVHRLNLAAGGNLQFALKQSRTSKPGFGYMMIELPASDINQVNGRAIKKVRPFPAIEPATKPDLQRPIEDQSKDSIQVEVVGVMKSGVVAVGGESTGFTITANGMTFEVNLMRFRIADPNGKRARISGRLDVKPGVEGKQRRIIDVANIQIFDADKPADQAKPAFKKIEILQSGGIAGIEIKTVVMADGKVTRVNDRTRVTESFELKADSLAKAHKLVRETDWSKVKIAPAPANVADAFQYSISISTNSDTHLFEFSEVSFRNLQPLRELMKAVGNR